FLGDAVGFRQRDGYRAGGLDPRRGDQCTGLPAGRGRRVRGTGGGGRRQRGDDQQQRGRVDLPDVPERGLLLTTLWYIREVDPTTLLLTGLTRDGVYLV